MKKRSIFLKKRGLGKIGLFTLAILAASPVAAQDVTTGLKAHYSFESVADGLVTDASGNGNAASVMGAATTTPGYEGNAMYFPTDATPAVDFLQMPNDITTTLTDFTVATWVKVDVAKGWARIFDFGSGTPNYMFLCPHQGSATGNLRYAIRINNGAEQLIEAPGAFPNNQWVHVAVTLQGTTGTLYVNGAAVGTNTNMTLNPSSLGATNQNYIAKAQWPDPALVGSVDDFRMYDRALTRNDILQLMGYPVELDQQKALLTSASLTSEDSAAITTNLVLPATLGSNVTVKWSSTNNSAIDTFGVVTRPQLYQSPVRLKATLSQTVNGKVYTADKEFLFIVAGPAEVPAFLATWDFDASKITTQNGVISVEDKESGFVGTCANGARVRTIGTPATEQFNVVDLGSNNGYFDMGTDIGKAVYSLADYTVGGYFRLPAGYSFSGNGHFLFSFANSNNSIDNPNGSCYLGFTNQRYAVTPTSWYGEQGLTRGGNAPVDGWHHIAFSQKGNTGTLYVDGVQVAQNTSMSNIPGVTLRQDSMVGTMFNWLGRSPYAADNYLKNALIYNFQLLSVPVSGDDLMDPNNVFNVAGTISRLDAAYTENPDYIVPGLNTEWNNLSIDTTDVTSNLSLPIQGTIDPAITITWKSSHTDIISTTGVVNQPDYHPYIVKLTATLAQNGQSVTKTFNVNVLAKTGTEFSSDLLVKYDFTSVANDTVVTDAAEKHFTGIVKNDAKIRTIGTTATGTFNVLALGDSIGYFDMGTEVGKLIYGLTDYTVGAYYRIDPEYTGLSSNGNFLWTFSNATNILNDASGYLFGSLKTQGIAITPSNWTGEQGVSLATPALTGNWHHFAYRQSDTLGTIFVDGMSIASGKVTQYPFNTLVKEQRLGTLYNWIGRSCYAGDAYLNKTLVADFRLYKTALSDEQIQSTVLNVAEKIGELDVAYAANTGMAVKTVKSSLYNVIATEGQITIQGLNGSEKVAVYDITGLQYKSTTPSSITLKAGMYIVKINDFVTKVIVK